MAMDKVGKGEPAALALLALIACLAPEGTPLAMIRQSQDRLPEPLGGVVADELRLNRVVTALRRYSLLSRSGDTLMTHPLIQVVTRDRLSPEERLTWLGTAVAVIWTVFGPKPGSTTRLLVDESSFPYVGQAFAVAQHLIPPVADAGMAIAMLDRLAHALSTLSRYRDAAFVLARALSIAQSARSSDVFRLQFMLQYVTSKAEEEELDW
jgi:hypothetical protein